MKHTLLIKYWLSSFLPSLFLRCCVIRGRPLAKGKECLSMCNINLSCTDYHLRKDNPVENCFRGRFLWNVLPLSSFMEKEVTSGKFSINLNTEDKKVLT